jgi:hypothetical protein
MGLLCRQQAAYNPAQSWKLLAEAEYWEHLAQVETSSHFEECNSYHSSDLAKVAESANSNDTRWKTIVAREYSHASGLAASIALKTVGT